MKKEKRKYGTITSKLITELNKEFNLSSSLFSLGKSFNDVEPNNLNKKIRYVYNLDKKEYVDLFKQPTQWCHYNNEIGIGPVKINSFALLIGCGNGLGGGDYYFVNHQSVGSWAGDRFVSSKEPLEEYKKFKCRDEIYNELKDNYKKIKKYNRFTKDKILKEEEKIFLKELKYLKDHDYDISKIKLDESGLLEEEKKLFKNILDKEKNLVEGDICL